MKCTSLVLAATCLIAIPSAFAGEAYSPAINPADFSIKIDNPLFNLPAGN